MRSFLAEVRVSATFLGQNTKIHQSVRHEKGRGQKRPFAIDFEIFTNACHFQRRLLGYQLQKIGNITKALQTVTF